MVRRWFCGDRGENGFSAAGLPVNATGGSEVILFGHVPADARTVAFAAEGGERLQARTHDAPGLRENVWALPVPGGSVRKGAAVAWTSADGEAQGRLDVSRELDDRTAP